MIERMSLEEAGWRLRLADGDELVPGVMVTHALDRFPIGMLIAIVGEELVILWSRMPRFDIRNDVAAASAREIQQEIDKDIIRLLTAMPNAQTV